MVMSKHPNELQRLVIDELDENIILFASAGTGKTYTVANRVANILAKERAKSEAILCLTFTIKACKEMQEDIAGYAGEIAEGVQVSTIHGFCYRLIMEEGKRTGNAYSNIGVCDEVDQEEILRNILSSRFYAWRVEEYYNELEKAVPNLQNGQLIVENEELWLWIDGVKISPHGTVLPCDDEDTTRAKLSCPVCDDEREMIGQVCAGCGQEYPFRFSQKQFDVYQRKGSLRGLVSEVKHCREEGDFYSSDVEKDYLDAFFYLKAEKPKQYESLLSYNARYYGYTPDEAFEGAMERYIGRLIKEYDEHLRRSNLFDFDDLILGAKAILASEEGNAYWSIRYKYIILDEMQDTSRLEYEVLRRIFAKNNVMLCGDIFQTIYGWRGSNPEEILTRFIDEFSAKKCMLAENYRSTQVLSKATFGYLQKTYPQWVGKYCPKDLQIHSENEGEKIACYAFDNEEQEAWQIYNYLKKNSPKHGTDVCILSRSNRYIAQLYRYFQQFNENAEKSLSFFTVEEDFQFFKKTVVKDALAVIKLLVNPFDCVSMERLTEKFVKKVGSKSIEALRRQSQIGLTITSFLEEQTHLYEDPYHLLLEGYNGDNLVVYDTETTGLDLEKDQIVQISAIKVDKNGVIIDTLDLLIQPTVEIGQGAYETHGFNEAYLREHGAITAKEGLEIFSNFVKNSVLIGHNNLAYDQKIVVRQLRTEGLPPLDILAEYDTLIIAKQFYPQLENYKLSTLCERFSVVNEQAHNALGDITATSKCLLPMIREGILPTVLERRAVVEKYREKFEKIYLFMQDLRGFLSKNEPIAKRIVEGLMLEKKYPAFVDRATIADLVESLSQFEGDERAFLVEYLHDASLSSSQMDVILTKKNRIPMITVHQAKGCEFNTVILVGADDNNFPNFVAKQNGEEEEEQKVFYVAITRAKERLIVTRTRFVKKYERNETPYFWRIPEEYVRDLGFTKNER